MNQDQVKENLLRLDSDVSDFKVIFSGKESRRVDGLYHPETLEIIIHNKNFSDNNSLMYTAIHEFAHHIQFTKLNENSKSRHHTILFWDTFHKLLEKAEAQKIYENEINKDEKLQKLTAIIKKDFIEKNGELMKQFGKMLIQALDLCQQKKIIFEDYVDRALGMGRTNAKAIMKVYAMDIDPTIGFDNMKIVSSVSDQKGRSHVEKAFKEGTSQDSVKNIIKESKPAPVETYSKLKKKRKKVENNIHQLELELEEIDTKIDAFEKEGE